MKEFKFDVDGDGIAIPVIRCETQREFNQTVASYRTDGKLSTNDPDGEVIYIIYKDGSTFYHNSADVSLNEGKYKRTGILRGVSSNPDGYEVFGDFAIDEYGNIVIDEKSIEEYGVYAGQYDVKEQEAPEVQETVEQTVETIAEGTSEVETTEQAQAEENKDTFEYRNYIISGNERTGIIAIDNHGNFSPKVYKTVEEAKKAVDEDIEYAEKKYAEMEAEQAEVEETAETETAETAEQTQADEAAETEPAKTPKSENVPYKMKWTNQNVDYSRANYTAVIFKFNNSKVWLQSDCVCSTQTARTIIRKLGKRFGSKSVDVKYFSDRTNEKIVSVCQLYDNSGYIFRNEIVVKNGEKRQFIKYAAKEIFE